MKWLTLLLIVVSGCAEQSGNPATQTTASSAIQVVDFSGQTVRLAKPATKIIALAPHVVENTFTAGAGDLLVGVVSYSNFPEQAKSLPLVAGYAKANLEKIIELNPDLVIAWESGNSISSIERIRSLGYPVYLDQPNTVADIAKSIRDIGTLSDTSTIAEKAAADFLQQVEQTRLRNAEKSPVRTFYQVWNSPLQTVNGNHSISAAIELCGGVNIYASESAIAPIINIESILSRNPEAIIASGTSKSRPKWLDDWHQWPSLSATKNNNLFFIEPDHIQRHTIRLLHGINAICHHLDSARGRRTE